MKVAFTPYRHKPDRVFDHHRGQGDQRQLDVARDIGKRLVCLYALNLVVVGVDRVDIAFEIIVLKIENRPTTDLLLIRRRAHNGN